MVSTPRIRSPLDVGCYRRHPALHDKANDQGVVVNSLAD